MYKVVEFGTRLENSVVSGLEDIEYRVFSPSGKLVKTFHDKEIAEDFCFMMNTARDIRKARE